MLNELIKGVLVIAIGLALKLGLAAIGVEIDPVLFNTLVAAIVVWIMAELGLEGVKSGLRRFKASRASKSNFHSYE